MLKLELDAEYLKRLALQHFFNRMPPAPHYAEYEAYFILDEEGEPQLIIEEKT